MNGLRALRLTVRSVGLLSCGGATACALLLSCGAAAQERHGRGYKPPPPTATVVVTVEKASNDKPMPNASVIFRAVHDEETTANLEMKTDPDGRASLDLLEVGSHVTVQVIAGGYATYASDFDLTPDGKQVVVKLLRPRAQVSIYGEAEDRPAELKPGVQEHHRTQGSAPAGSVQSAPAVKPVPPIPVPAATPGSSTVPPSPAEHPGSPTTTSNPGSPQ